MKEKLIVLKVGRATLWGLRVKHSWSKSRLLLMCYDLRWIGKAASSKMSLPQMSVKCECLLLLGEMAVKGMDFGIRQTCLWIAALQLNNYVTLEKLLFSLSLSFLIYEMGIIMHPHRIFIRLKRVIINQALAQVPRNSKYSISDRYS